MTEQPDASRLPLDWAEALAERGLDQEHVEEIVASVYDEPGAAVFPARSDVFRAFHLTKLADVRVVILGQDPYPRPDQAHGLAFSVPAGVRPPRSLGAIFRNLESDPAVMFSKPGGGDLTAWASNGVLLMNTSLTVNEGDPGSHDRLWRGFTNLVLHVINEECPHVAFLLWGSHAIRTATSVPLDEQRHRLIRTSHPAAWGRTTEKRFKDCAPFSEANDFVAEHWHAPLTWAL